MSMHLGKSICDHFLTMYSNVLHNTTVHSMPLSELSDNFSDHKKIPQPRALSRFCRAKIIKRSVLIRQACLISLFYKGFRDFSLHLTQFLTSFFICFIISVLYIISLSFFMLSIFCLNCVEIDIVFSFINIIPHIQLISIFYSKIPFYCLIINFYVYFLHFHNFSSHNYSLFCHPISFYCIIIRTLSNSLSIKLLSRCV